MAACPHIAAWLVPGRSVSPPLQPPQQAAVPSHWRPVEPAEVLLAGHLAPVPHRDRSRVPAGTAVTLQLVSSPPGARSMDHRRRCCACS